MKILLISPDLSTEDRYGKALGKVGPMTEPLGLAYLATAIREKRKQDVIEIIDMAALNYDQKDIANHMYRFKPDVVGITILTPAYIRAIEIIRIIKFIVSNAKIIVGGAHPTIFPMQILKDNPEIDIAVIGEGEITTVQLLDALENNKSFSKIKGIAYRQDDKIIINSCRGIIRDLNTIPRPARNLLNMKLYKPAPTYYRKLPSYVMMISRGCPYKCVFCSRIAGKLYRHHTVERIILEMRVLIFEYGAKEIIFRDETFTINRKLIINLCNEIIQQGLNRRVKWTCMTRVDLVDEDLLHFMNEAGCWSIHYGAESGSQRLLDMIQKGITIKQIKDAFRWTRKAGIEVKAFFMLGLPTETREDSLQTLKFTKECGADWIQVTLTVPYPGTKLYELAKKDGTLKSFRWENYQTWAGWTDRELVYVPKGRTQEGIKGLQRKAMREFYFRPVFILKQIFNGSLFYNFRTYINGGYALLKKDFKH